MNIKEAYYFNFNLNSIYDSFMVNSQVIFCDNCDIKISGFNSLNTKFWHSNILGDLCDKCYNLKKEREKYIRRLVQIKMLMEGKKILFQKELKKYKTINYYDIKCKNNYSKLKGITQNLISNFFLSKKNNNCSICLDIYGKKEICSGTCGHVFHETCCKKLKVCPVCRKKTKFFKLYF